MADKLFDTSGKEIYIAGYPVSWWLNKYELPVHLYYAPVIRDNIRAFKDILKRLYPNGRVCFAAKANTHPLVLKIAKEEGCGADVASYNEMRCALESGMKPEMLDLNGNCKENFLIEDAINKGMNIIADSIEEAEVVEEIASRKKKKCRMLLRVSGYDLEHVTDDSVFTAGKWTKFGTAIELVPHFIRTIDRFRYAQLVGFHTHIGSQVAKVEPYFSVIGKLIEMGHLLNSVGKKCEVINIGGGFPVCYVPKEMWNLITQKIRDGYSRSTKGDNSKIFVWHDSLAGFMSEGDPKVHLDRWTGERFYTSLPKEKMLEALLRGEITVNGKKKNTVQALKELGGPMLTIEPGRSIVEDAGVTLAKVGIVKKVAGPHDLTCLEMGITNHGESLIEKPVKKWELVNNHDLRDVEPFETFIGGNLCFSGDMISKYKVFLQRKPKRGDIIMIHDTGAYSSSLLTANSNSFPRPARVLVDERGKVRLIKRRDQYKEIIQK